MLDLKLSGNRLWVGGNFSKFAAQDQVALTAVNATTGAFDPYMQLPFAGTHNGGRTSIQKFDITPDGSKLLVIGNFTVVGGVAHDQAAMLDLTGPSAALANWSTNVYTLQLDVQAKISLMVAAYAGAAGTTPVVAHAGAAEPGTTTAHVTPTLSTAANGAWLLSYWADVTSSTTSWATPAGQSVRATLIGTGGGHPSAVLTDLGGPLTPGAVGGYTATADAASSKATMVTLVLGAP